MSEEVEGWENKIRIAGIQETKADENSRETRKGYTWYFSGEGGREGGEESYLKKKVCEVPS